MTDAGALPRSMPNWTRPRAPTANSQRLVAYLRQAPAADAAWAVYFLIGRRPRRTMSARKLAVWAAEAAGISEWLFEASYHQVGDLAETIALLLPPPRKARGLRCTPGSKCTC
jgi:DNA ligase 1